MHCQVFDPGRCIGGLCQGRPPTVGTGARDLRRNALEKSFTFAFATGDEINQGGIAGQVFSDHELTATAHVWAYDLDHFAGVIGSDEPAYRTQSGGVLS